MAAAGLTGAVIALAGAWGFQASRGSDPAIAALSERIKTNESALAELGKTAGPGLKAMEKRVAALEASVKEQAASDAALKADIDKLKADGTPKAVTSVAAPTAEISKLETRIAALEKLSSEAKTNLRATSDPDVRKPANDSVPAATGDKTASGTPPGDQSADNKSATDKPANDKPSDGQPPVQAKPADTAAPIQLPAAIAKLPPEVATLETRLAALEKKIKPPADLGPVKASIAALAGKLEPLEKQVDSKVAAKVAPLVEALAKSATTIASNAKAIETTDAKAATSMVRSNAAATAIVARTLVERMAAGKPFDGLVDAIAAMGAKDEQLKVLKSVAAKGVPTAAALQAAFKALESKVLARETPKQDAPIIDRLKQRAFSLVKVRPVGKSDSTSPAALFANITAALGDGEFIEAMKLYKQLPENGREAAGAWAKQLQTRIDAENAAQSILSDSLTLLQQQKS